MIPQLRSHCLTGVGGKVRRASPYRRAQKDSVNRDICQRVADDGEG